MQHRPLRPHPQRRGSCHVLRAFPNFSHLARPGAATPGLSVSATPKTHSWSLSTGRSPHSSQRSLRILTLNHPNPHAHRPKNSQTIPQSLTVGYNFLCNIKCYFCLNLNLSELQNLKAPAPYSLWIPPASASARRADNPFMRPWPFGPPAPPTHQIRSSLRSHVDIHTRGLIAAPSCSPLGYFQHDDDKVRFAHGTGWEADDRAR